MSQEADVDVKSELKRALIMGDTYRAEKLLSQGKELGVFTQTEFVQLQQAIEKAKFGTMKPLQDPDLYALASKM